MILYKSLTPIMWIRSLQSKCSTLIITGTAHKCTVNIMQSYFYSQPFSTLSSRRTVNSSQPCQVPTLAQVPALLQPQILCAININKLQIPFPWTKTKGEQRGWERVRTSTLTHHLRGGHHLLPPPTLLHYNRNILYMNSYISFTRASVKSSENWDPVTSSFFGLITQILASAFM